MERLGMKRSRRIVIALALLGMAASVLTLWLPVGRRSPVAEALLSSPTTQASGSGYTFTPIGGPEAILVAPDAWYSFALPFRFGPMGGSVSTGKVSWQTSLGHATPPPKGALPYARLDGYPSAHGDGLIITTTPLAGVLALDELSRQQVWSVTPAEPIARVAWSDSLMVIASSGRHVYGIDHATGAVRWTYDLQGDLETDLLSTPKGVYMGVDGDQPQAGQSHDPLLVCLDPRDGRVLSRTPLPHRPTGLAAAGGVVFCAMFDAPPGIGASLAAINTVTGKVIWESTNFVDADRVSRRRPQGPAVDGNSVCMALDAHVYAFDAGSGARQWLWPPPNLVHPPREVGWPLCRDGVVYFTMTDGAIALDIRSGRELWGYTSPRQFGGETRAPASAISPTLTGNAITLPFRGGSTPDHHVLHAPTVDVVRLPTALRASGQPAAVPIGFPLAIAAVALLLIGLIVAAWLRRLRGTLACLGMVALALTLWAWAGSYSSNHFIGLKRFALSGSDQLEVATGIDWADGAVTFGRRQTVWNGSFPRGTQGDATAPFWWTRRPPPILSNGICLEEPVGDLGLHRFTWTHRSRPSGAALGPQAQTSLTLPLWLIAALFALTPFAWLTGLWRDRGRIPKGHCPNCGYDLRATSGRCPECGRQNAHERGTLQPNTARIATANDKSGES
jgi:outer membrane protein assembly factor BamB